MTLPRVLQQSEVWVDGRGVTHRLDEMDRHHRANLIPFLRGNARRLQLAAEMQLAASPDVPGEAFAEFDDPAEDWLERTPLMRRLVELEQGRPLVDRALTAARNTLHEARTGYRKVRLG